MAENTNISANSREQWSRILTPKRSWFDLSLGELWRYRELIWLFVKRDFVTFYKQTILGPLWYVIQPVLTTVVFTFIFGKVAQISTDDTPAFLFYLSGTVCWTYFSSCLIKTSNTFIKNAGIFGKVYFPRLSVPISIVIINLVQFMIQFVLFLGVYAFYYFRGAILVPNTIALLLPLLILQMALLGLGSGIFVSSLTTKYRDLSFAMNFAVQLWMYATPIVYPLSIVSEKYRWVYLLNPMTSVIEVFRYGFLGAGVVKLPYILTSWGITLGILLVSLLLFTRIEKDFMDTV